MLDCDRKSYKLYVYMSDVPLEHRRRRCSTLLIIEFYFENVMIPHRIKYNENVCLMPFTCSYMVTVIQRWHYVYVDLA